MYDTLARYMAFEDFEIFNGRPQTKKRQAGFFLGGGLAWGLFARVLGIGEVSSLLSFIFLDVCRDGFPFGGVILMILMTKGFKQIYPSPVTSQDCFHQTSLT